MRTVVFGVDGLTFRVLHPLIERGMLPNFQKLSQEGCEAILESKYPPITPAAWMSLATGLKPAGHGIYDFWEFVEQPHSVREPKSRLLTRRKGGKAIWNLLSELGKQVLVINVPMTYPPEPINGIMVSGYMTPSSKADFTYPTPFKEELYRVVPEYLIDLEKEDVCSVELTGKAERLIDATLRMTQSRIELTTYMLKEKPWDFCFVAFVGADRLQHPLWEEISSLDAKAIEYFLLLDHGLGLILDQLGPDDSLFMVSDHGFQAADRTFEINEYLYSQKLLALSPSAQQHRMRSQYRSNIKHAVVQMGLLPLARAVKRGLRAPSLDQFANMPQPLNADFDWEHTFACVPSHSSFSSGYANIFLREALDAERLAELCQGLRNQMEPQSGTPLIDALYTTEVFGTGPYAPREPHLLLLPTDGMTFRMSLGNRRLWDNARLRHDLSKRCGIHHKDGVLYAYGAGIKRGFKAPRAEVFDLVPTVLHSMGLPVDQHFDGRVLDELFIEDDLTAQPVIGASNQANRDIVQRKLQRLLTL